MKVVVRMIREANGEEVISVEGLVRQEGDLENLVQEVIRQARQKKYFLFDGFIIKAEKSSLN